MNHEQLPRLWGLTTLATILHWTEEFANTLSGPLLVVGLGISLVDLLTDGGLTVSVPILLYVWAVSQAVGVDAQLVGSFARARHALRTGQRWHLVGLLALGAGLAYVGWIAAEVFATSQAQHISTTAALSRLGFDQTSWIVQRTALSVFLVALSGWTRYVAPPRQSVSLVDERARLERELELEPLRQRARLLRTVGGVRLARTAVAAALRGDGETEPPTHPTGGGSPVALPAGGYNPDLDEPDEVSEEEDGASRSRSGGGAVRRPRRISAEARARRVWHPGMSVRQLAERAHIGRSAASKYARVFRERDEVSRADGDESIALAQ